MNKSCKLESGINCFLFPHSSEDLRFSFITCNQKCSRDARKPRPSLEEGNLITI